MRQHLLYPNRLPKWKWFKNLSNDAKLAWYFIEEGVDHGGFTQVDWRKIASVLGLTQKEFKIHVREIPGNELISYDNWFWFVRWFEPPNWPPTALALQCFFDRQPEFGTMLEYQKLYSELREFRPQVAAVSIEELQGSADYKRAVSMLPDEWRINEKAREIVMRWWLYRAENGKPPRFLQWSQFLAENRGRDLAGLDADIRFSIGKGYSGLYPRPAEEASSTPAKPVDERPPRPLDTKVDWRPMFTSLFPDAKPPKVFWDLRQKIQDEVMYYCVELREEVNSYRTN